MGEIDLISHKAVPGDFNIETVSLHKKLVEKHVHWHLSDLFKLTGDGNLMSVSLKNDNLNYNFGTFDLEEPFKEPFKKMINENSFDRKTLHMTSGGYIIQLKDIVPKYLNNSVKKTIIGHYILLKIFDINNLDAPDVNEVKIYTKIKELPSLTKNFKIDARSVEYDDSDTDFVCIDFRVLSTSIGSGKGDFNIYDAYLDNLEGEEDHPDDPHHLFSPSSLKQVSPHFE